MYTVKRHKRSGTVTKHTYELTATSQFLPFIRHKGILIIEGGNLRILHNSPTLTNGVGGSVISEPLTEWLQNRSITNIEQIDIDQQETILPLLESKRYDIFTYNCEHFVCDLRSKPRQSPQLFFWMLMLIFYLLISRNG